MQDFINQVFGSLHYIRRAKFHDYKRYKPHLIKTITCVGGKKTCVWKQRNQHAHWLYECRLCGATGLTRGDRMDIFRCKCVKNVKRPRKYKAIPEKKICPDCGKTYLLTVNFWYKQVKKGRAYFNTRCKKCCKRQGREYYDRTHVTFKERSGTRSYLQDDCGRAI